MTNYILSPTAQVRLEIINHLFNEHNQYVGFAIKPSFLIKHIAYLTSFDENDVLKTLEQMKADSQLIETGFYYPDTLYSLNPEML